MNERVEKLEKRTEEVIEWIKKHRILIVQTDSVKLEINIKGGSIKGQVTSFPQE